MPTAYNIGEIRMVSGKHLSEEEKEYIRKNYPEKFKSEIAKELGELFEEDNGGSRQVRAIRKFIEKEGLDIGN